MNDKTSYTPPAVCISDRKFFIEKDYPARGEA